MVGGLERWSVVGGRWLLVVVDGGGRAAASAFTCS